MAIALARFARRWGHLCNELTRLVSWPLDPICTAGGRAELSLVDERALHRGDVATLVPPDDVHNHGHVLGSGPSPYSLILLGDDMLLFERQEYDPDRGAWRGLAPGDPGRSNR